MKEGWEYKKLPDISENLDSLRKPVTKKNRTTGIYPYYGASGVVDYVDDYLFDENLLCISEDGANLIMRTYPIAFPISGKVWVNNHAHVLRFKDMATQKYVEYYFAGLILDEYITGAAQPKLTQKALNSITIYIPNLIEEQQSIVDYLDSAFAKIDAMKANAEKALNEAKALFQASLKEMLEPKEGWEEKKVGEIAEIKGGKRLPKGEKLQSEPTNHKYIRVADFNEYGTVDLDEIQYISDNVYEQIKRYIIKKEDIYISIAGTIGKSGIIPEELDGANLTENACRLILSKEIDQRFMYYITISPEFIRQEIESTKISAQPKLALTRLADIIIAYPPIVEQQSIVTTLDTIKSKVNRLQANFDTISKECGALKQALLRQVFE